MRKDHTLPRGELHRLHHVSEVLVGNALGDPVDRELYVWTPPSWKHGRKAAAARRPQRLLELRACARELVALQRERA